MSWPAVPSGSTDYKADLVAFHGTNLAVGSANMMDGLRDVVRAYTLRSVPAGYGRGRPSTERLGTSHPWMDGGGGGLPATPFGQFSYSIHDQRSHAFAEILTRHRAWSCQGTLGLSLVDTARMSRTDRTGQLDPGLTRA